MESLFAAACFAFLLLLNAKIILGQKEAPPPERLRRHDGVDLSSGVNFANSGSGVFPGWNLDKQIKKFKRLLRKRIIGKEASRSRSSPSRPAPTTPTSPATCPTWTPW
ncbi:GDSL esterase/lipase [Panicum miliaceum]|uniref:GDSL esterase/lipase n=1 Tax=Panicum miliaceum TaxID=4540 RepID=A0A3L6QVG1_PANMI|nr:GDSL esterase/lipase [Panicum miliaceum]